MRIEIEGLEHHADAPAQRVDIGVRMQQIDAVNDNGPAARLLQPVEAAQQRALARTRRADNEHELLRRHRQIDALEHIRPAEGFAQAPHVEEAGFAAPSWDRAIICNGIENSEGESPTRSPFDDGAAPVPTGEPFSSWRAVCLRRELYVKKVSASRWPCAMHDMRDDTMAPWQHPRHVCQIVPSVVKEISTSLAISPGSIRCARVLQLTRTPRSVWVRHSIRGYLGRCSAP